MNKPTFKKTAPHERIEYEVAGLKWLADAEGVRVVPVIDVGETWLLEPQLRSATPSRSAANEFGQLLAITHSAGADGFGSAPPGISGSGGMNAAPLLFPDHPMDHWGQFYAKYRVRPYLNGPFTPEERSILIQFCEVLESGILDHPQPKLVSTAARIHGDLWSGNVMWTAEGATLIDPAAQGGHAEEDFGALALFGAPHLDEIFEGYNQVSPLAPGWEDRIALHQMHILMIHCFLFGRGYVPQTVETAARYVSNVG